MEAGCVDLSNHDSFKIAPDEAIFPCARDCDPLRKTEDAVEILQFALESAGAGIWELDLVTEMLQLCPQSLRMFGMPDNHSGLMTREDWLKLFDAEDAEQFKGLAVPPRYNLAPSFNDFRICRPDGEVRWLRISGRYLPDKRGYLTRLVGLQFDDTVRKRAEKVARERDESFHLTQEAALIGTFVTDANFRTVGSRQFYRNLGLPEDREFIVSETYMGLIHPDDLERVKRETLAAAESADGLDLEYRIKRADTGEIRWIFLRNKYERADDGRLIQINGAHLDITKPRRTQAALHESVALNQSMMESSADCVKLIDLDGRLQFMNKHGLAALKIGDPSRILGGNWAELLPLEERPKVEAAIHNARNGQIGRFNAECPTATGESRWWDVIVTAILDERGQPCQLLAISRDLTEHRDHLEQISWTASHDMLTGLPNRRYFQDRLEKDLMRAAASGSHVGLLQLDVDNFKQVNDALGHDAGDALLKIFSLRLQSVIQGKEKVVRLGGDEFAIIVPDLTTSRSLTHIVEAIQARLAEPFIYQGSVLDCRASIGQAIYPQHGGTIDTLLKSADIALYVAKSTGRGTVRRFQASMRTNMDRRLAMVNRARAALQNDMIFPFYQPKIDFRTGAPAGFEALLRWRDPNRKIQLPARIAAAFEDPDVAQAVSERMQLRVLADMRQWLDEGVDFGHIAINASAAEFRQNNFAERLLDRVRAAGIPTSYIELEVTETVFLGRGAEYVDRALHRLSVEGVRIALDDFGTGYASLSHLKQFPVDIIKIDQSFVRDLEVNPNDSAIICALIGLGKSLSIGIVAEGIQDRAQAAFLAELGCDYGQGYLFSKAVAAASVPRWLSQWQYRNGSIAPFGEQEAPTDRAY